MNKVSLKEYVEFKNEYVDSFFPKNLDTWSSRVLLECIDDKELMEELKKYLSINHDNTNAQRLDLIMSELREKTNNYFKLAKESNDLTKAFTFASRAMVYFGILESINELSSFADDLIVRIQNKYPKKYLKLIQRIDRDYLSIDAKKILDDTDNKINIDDDLLKKYLVLKKWQDNQHTYYLNLVEPYLYPLEEEYMKMAPIPLANIEFESAQKHRLFSKLCSQNLINLDDLTKAYIAGIDKELIKLIGGKGYGLTILNSLGAKVPLTYVIPTLASDCKSISYDKLPMDMSYSVRSSADIEDGESNSFAGMFDSYLNVSYEKINENAMKVVASKHNNRLQKYIEKNGLQQPNMAVVIQKFVEPEYAGVWIGKSSTSGVLEYVKGNGEKLVSGRVTPSREIWENMACKKATLMDKKCQIGKKLLELQNKLIEQGKGLSDFEWMILDNELVMLQYRPVTSEINLQEMDNNDEEFTTEGKKIFHGIAASPGVVSGKARFINAREIKKVHDWHEGDILMAWFTDPEWMDILSKSSGIVTAVGGFLCHSAIVARELGIPCVIGIGSNMKQLWNEKEITIDGNKGIAYGMINDEKKANSNKKNSR